MEHRRKTKAAAEQACVRSLERHSSLQEIEDGRARIFSPSEYPEPLKRFLSRQRDVLHVRLSRAARKKLEQVSRATGINVDELALRWVEQGISRAAS
jgi:hypothetical protein